MNSKPTVKSEMNEFLSWECTHAADAKTGQISLRKKLLILPVGVIVWGIIYHQLPKATEKLTYDLSASFWPVIRNTWSV